ncbi:MAG TPA: hypothetical protein VFM27_21200 [Acidimicrobiales bacterium]|nr:hypothetical protein [Acidimicrobiales bacterium]
MGPTLNRRRSLVAVLVVGVCIAAIAVGMVATSGTRRGSGRKQAQACEQARADAVAATAEPLELDDSNDEIVIDFGAGRSRRIDMVEVRSDDAIPGAWNEFGVNVGILSFESRRELEGEGLVAIARRVSRDTINVSLCIDPELQDVEPGTYQGVLHISDERLEDMEIPVTVHAQDRNSWLWLVLAVAGGMGASIVAYTIHGRPERPEAALRRSQFLPVLILITVGFGAAMVRAINAYNEDRAWGATPWDGLLLLAQTVPLGYGATVGVSDILKQLGGPPDLRVATATSTASAEAGTGDPSEEPGT